MRDFTAQQNLSNRMGALVRFLEHIKRDGTGMLIVSEMNRDPPDNAVLVDVIAKHGYALIAKGIKNEQSDKSFGTFIFARSDWNNYTAVTFAIRAGEDERDVNRVPMVTIGQFCVIGFHGTLDVRSPDRLNQELEALANVQCYDRTKVVVGDANLICELADQYCKRDRNLVPSGLCTFAGWPTDRLNADAVRWFAQHRPSMLFDTDRCLTPLDMVWVDGPARATVKVLNPSTFEPFDSFEQQLAYANNMPPATETISDHFPLSVVISHTTPCEKGE